MNFKEFDLRKEANKNMEFITPEKVRKWLADKVHFKYNEIKTVFDPAVGSGQLFQFIKAEKYIGCDINDKSLECFKNNFTNSVYLNDSYFNLDVTNYDLAISNYPFSLNNKDLFEKAPIELEQFFNKNITGKADFPFVIRSFLNSDKGGFYLCFPGIAYRGQEQKFRDFLIKNNYVESYGILKNCNFDATNIEVFYLELKKDRENKEIETFVFDFDNNDNNIIEHIKFDSVLGGSWITPQKEEIKKEIDISKLEKEIEFLKNKRREAEDELDNFIKFTFKQKNGI